MEKGNKSRIWLIVGLVLVSLATVFYFISAGLSGDPQASQAHLKAGKELLDRGDTAAAIKELEQAALKDPRSRDAQFNLGLAYARAERYQDAAEAFETALTMEADVNTYSNLGVIYYKMGRMNDALAQYQEALKLKPDDTEVRANMAAAYVQLGRIDEAQAEYEKIVTLSPALAEAYYGLGVTYGAKGDNQKAIAAFERFLELDTGRDPQARTEAEKMLQALRGREGNSSNK